VSVSGSLHPDFPQVPGPLTLRVLAYQDLMKELVPTAKTEEAWAPLAELVATEQFERVGTFLEVQNWPQYLEMVRQWASSIERFDTTVRRISELPGLVYFEIEERHHRGDRIDVVNSMSVFAFNEDVKICRLDVYLQQAR